VVYYNDAVTESFLRVPVSELGPGQYTLVVQGMGGATQKILLYLRVRGLLEFWGCTPGAALVVWLLCSIDE
jgi:hypothetical protein